MIRLLALAATAAAVLTGSASAASPWKPYTITKQAGPISVSLSGERQPESYGADFRDLQLVVKDGSKTVYDHPYCNPERCSFGTQHGLKLQNVWGGSLDEVIVSNYTGGAHCCFQTLVVLVDGPRAGKTVSADWGDIGYQGQVHDGTFDFVSADDRFSYEFTSFAGSGFPMMVEAINPAGTAFTDVTKTRLDLVRKDAASYWKSYLADRGTGPNDDARGVFAAWCADEYTLGLGAMCQTELASGVKAGYLNGFPGWPRGPKFATALEKFLRQTGYITS